MISASPSQHLDMKVLFPEPVKPITAMNTSSTLFDRVVSLGGLLEGTHDLTGM
jgi:hypothetical protein